MTSYHSYGKVFQVGHGAIRDLFADPVIVEEKLDGSQISFGNIDGELRIRSKGVQINQAAPEKMFAKGVAVIKELFDQGRLVPGWTYRGEYFDTPNHNVLAYDRIPNGHIMGFDVNTGHEVYLSYAEKVQAFKELGLETTPLVFSGVIKDLSVFREFLDRTSVLGGQKIEGVVAKNYLRFCVDGHAMLGKFVSEDFKEIHNGEFRKKNPGRNEIIEKLISMFSTEARFHKAIQHLREKGELTESPKDIGPLMREMATDVHTECMEQILKMLEHWAWPQISRGVCGPIPIWYKQHLAAKLQEQMNAAQTSGQESEVSQQDQEDLGEAYKAGFCRTEKSYEETLTEKELFDIDVEDSSQTGVEEYTIEVE